MFKCSSYALDAEPPFVLSLYSLSILFSAPLLEPNLRTDPPGASSPMSPYMTAMQKPQEPNIDFELDVKVLINSGKCVLHTKEASGTRDDEIKM